MEPSEIEAMFKHLGLTRYESKAMITLLSFGSCSADKVTSLSGIPLPRVYDTMNNLAKKGFISVSKTRPEVFKAVNPERLFEILQEEEEKKMKLRVKELKEIMPQLLKQMKKLDQGDREDPEEVLAVVKKRVNMKKDRELFHSMAKNNILVFAGDMSWVTSVKDQIRSLIRKKVRYNVIFSKRTPDALKNAKIFKKIGAKVKHSPEGGELRCLIIDNKIISVVTKQYRSDNEAEYGIININNPLIAEVFSKYFSCLWNEAEKI